MKNDKELDKDEYPEEQVSIAEVYTAPEVLEKQFKRMEAQL